jgi:hypothetical protein
VSIFALADVEPVVERIGREHFSPDWHIDRAVGANVVASVDRADHAAELMNRARSASSPSAVRHVWGATTRPATAKEIMTRAYAVISGLHSGAQ